MCCLCSMYTSLCLSNLLSTYTTYPPLSTPPIPPPSPTLSLTWRSNKRCKRCPGIVRIAAYTARTIPSRRTRTASVLAPPANTRGTSAAPPHTHSHTHTYTHTHYTFTLSSHLRVLSPRRKERVTKTPDAKAAHLRPPLVGRFDDSRKTVHVVVTKVRDAGHDTGLGHHAPYIRPLHLHDLAPVRSYRPHFEAVPERL